MLWWREKSLSAVDTGCGRTRRVKPICVCLKMWACQHLGMNFHCTGGLMRRLQFTVHTEAFICQSQTKIRRYQKGLRVRVISSGRHPQGGVSANFRGDMRIDIHSRADFIWVWVFQIRKIAFGIRHTIPSITQGPFFLPHTWAKLWMRCYLFTPCWTERCALFICSDRRDSRVGRRPGKTLKWSAV